MDGQTNVPVGMLPRKLTCVLAVLFAMAVVLGVSSRSFGEAMGKALLEDKPATSAAVASTSIDAPKAAAPLLGLKDVAGPSIPAPSEKTVSGSSDVSPKANAEPVEEPKVAPREIESRQIRRSGETKDTIINGAGTTAPPSTTSLPSGVTQTLQVAAALTVVIGLIFVGKAVARKYLPQAKAGNGKGVIEVLARYPLSKNQSLVLVRIGSQIVTLNQGKDMSQSVLVINEPTEVAKILGQIDGQNPNSIQSGFNKLLANARMDLEDPANDPERDSFELRSMEPENLDNQLEEMAAAKRQLMELRQQVRSVRDSLPRG